MEQVEGLLDRRAELLLAAEDDLLLLHVGREAVGHEVVVFGRGRPGLVPPREPGVEAAADRAVGDVDDVAGGPQHHALAAGIGAAALRDDPRRGADVGQDLGDRLAVRLVVDHDLLRPLPRHLGRIGLEQVLPDFRRVDE